MWELMKDEGRTPQELAELAGCPVPEALVILTELELGGWVERAPGPTFHRRVA